MVCLGVDPGISNTGLAVVEASPSLADFSRFLWAFLPCQCDVVRIYAIYDGGFVTSFCVLLWWWQADVCFCFGQCVGGSLLGSLSQYRQRS